MSEPQPGDGPDYHAEHAAWARRHKTATTEEVFERWMHSRRGYTWQEDKDEFDRWLEAHDREVRREALLSAAEALRGDQEVRDRNGVGWLPTNSLMGAARVLEHLAARR